jgi:hypothetical protein
LDISTCGPIGFEPIAVDRPVDEDEALEFDVDLAIEPVLALPRDVGTILLDHVPGAFSS